jgi:membrane protein DedA with SNARE-associated domain
VEEAAHLVGSLEHVVHNYGAVAVMVILALEAMGAPVPGETLLIFASVLAARGELSLPALLIFACLGAMMGDNIGYLIGRRLGRAVITHHGARIGMTGARFDMIEKVFARYGALTVAAARFVNVLRQLNGIVAGCLGMDWRRFLMFNALGAVLWVAAWVLGAYFLDQHLSVIVRLAHHAGVTVGTVAAILLIVGLIVLWARSRRPPDPHSSRIPNADEEALK